MAMGVAFILSALFVKYRDIGPIWEVVLQKSWYVCWPNYLFITYLLQRADVCCKGYDVRINRSDFTGGYASFYY